VREPYRHPAIKFPQNDFFSALRFAARGPLARGIVLFFNAYPAFIPHPGQPGLGNIPGYYQPSLSGLVQIRLRLFLITDTTLVAFSGRKTES
jgi:hypothetical protein